MNQVFVVFSLNEINMLNVRIQYNKNIVDFFKTIIGRRYDSTTKTWQFPLSSYQNIKDELTRLGCEISKDLSKDELNANSKMVKFQNNINDTVEVFSSFDMDLIKVLKKHSARFDGNKRVWIIFKSKQPEIIKDLEEQNFICIGNQINQMELDEIDETGM